MNQTPSRLYFSLLLALCFLTLLPKSFTQKIRETYVQGSSWVQYNVLASSKGSAEEIDHLRLENHLLATQLRQVSEFLTSDEKIEEEFKRWDLLSEAKADKDSSQREFFKRREELLLKRLEQELTSINAKVVYREPISWSSLLWIDVGSEDNKKVGKEVVALNSPVLKGNVIIGVVDYVGSARSRVRLVTDTSLSLSVRVLRGGLQNKALLDHLMALSDELKLREDLFFSAEEQQNTLFILSHLKENLKTSVHDRYLAKGELHGSSQPLWRSRSQLLEGIGFNYDYPDAEGPARDLRTGETLEKRGDPQILVQGGDLLVTTGLDGVFPEGFFVAMVEEVAPLEEGATSYDLKARSLVEDLNELRYVSVLPSSSGECFKPL